MDQHALSYATRDRSARPVNRLTWVSLAACGISWLSIAAAGLLGRTSWHTAADILVTGCGAAVYAGVVVALAAILIGPNRGRAIVALVVQVASWAVLTSFLPRMP